MQTKRRLGAPLIVMFGVIMAMVAFAAPANAGPYANQPTTSVNKQVVTAGSHVVFCGQGFLQGETVNISLDNGIQYPSVVAHGPGGKFCTNIVLPATLTAGTHTLTATGATSGRTSSTTIQVLGVSANAAPIPASSGLAFTGANAIGIGGLGGLLLLGGGAMVLVARRRKVNA
jgi:hypothetical protein